MSKNQEMFWIKSELEPIKPIFGEELFKLLCQYEKITSIGFGNIEAKIDNYNNILFLRDGKKVGKLILMNSLNPIFPRDKKRLVSIIADCIPDIEETLKYYYREEFR